MLIANILVLICLAISVLLQYISPEKMSSLSFLSMFFLPLVLMNICFVFFWAAHLKWQLLLSLFALTMMFGNLKKSFSLKKTDNIEFKEEKSIKILTFNAMLFNFYKKNSKALDYIANSDADIICIQEFGWYKTDKQYLSIDDILSKMNKYPYKHIYTALDGEKMTYGIATFSKYPIIKKKKIDFESNFNSSIFCDIKYEKDTLRVFNNHLESNRLTEKEKKNLTDDFSSEIISKTAEKIGKAATLRAKQAEIIAQEIKDSPYRVIVCGDFNDMPVSYTYNTICSKNKLKDSFINSGAGMGVTFRDNLYRFRIDYILMDQRFSYSNHTIEKVKYSDHYPVWCYISLN